MTISPKAAKALRQLLGRPTADDVIDVVNTIDVFDSTEAGYLNGVTAGTVAASKALVLDSSKEITTGGLVIAGMATTAGAGITDAVASYTNQVIKVGTLFKTTIVIDLTGLRSTAADAIIGDDGTEEYCHIGQITAARNGTIFAGSITCLEAPAGGDPDIDLYSAVEATGAESVAVAGLDETQLIDAGDHAANAFKSLTAFPAANEYLYLVAGDTTDADYTAGILVIELWGK